MGLVQGQNQAKKLYSFYLLMHFLAVVIKIRSKHAFLYLNKAFCKNSLNYFKKRYKKHTNIASDSSSQCGPSQL